MSGHLRSHRNKIKLMRILHIHSLKSLYQTKQKKNIEAQFISQLLYSLYLTLHAN